MSSKPKSRRNERPPALPRTDPRDLETANEQLRDLRRLLRVSGYEFARRVAVVRDQELHLKAGYTSLEQWWSRLFSDLSTRTLWRVLEFADSIPGEVARAFDPAKLEAGLPLLPKNARGDRIVTLAGLRAVRVTAMRGDEEVELTFAEATPEELEEAVRAQRRASLTDPEPEFVDRLEVLNRKLGSGATRLGEARHQRQGSHHVAIIAIDQDHLDDFMKLLK